MAARALCALLRMRGFPASEEWAERFLEYADAQKLGDGGLARVLCRQTALRMSNSAAKCQMSWLASPRTRFYSQISRVSGVIQCSRIASFRKHHQVCCMASQCAE
jgi:hypothetical protein